MSFDRNAAIAYARQYWDRPCDDGVFWRTDYAVEVDKMRKVLGAPVKDGWHARFVQDGLGTEHAVFQREVGGKVEEKESQPWAGLADCAHFLSRCLTAGGFSIHEISVPKLVEHLKGRPDTKVLAEQVTRDRGQGIVDTGILDKGDMLGYFNIDPQGDYGGRRQYSHSTMFVGKLKPNDAGRITCHTKSRFGGLSAFPDEWHLADPAYKYTFIHIGRDDPASVVSARALHGWWRMGDVGAQFYYLTLDGRVIFTMNGPRSALDSPAHGLSTGHYFADGGKVTLIWKLGGDVEVWQPLRADEYVTSTNQIPGPHVTRWREPRGGHRH
jgi:hypothetical protein